MRIELQSKKAKLKTAGKFVEEDIEVAAKLQSKNVTPTESPQTANTDSGFSGIDKVEVGAIPSDYVGSAITRKGETTYTPTTTDQEIASGQYLYGKQIIKGDANLTAENIAKGKTVFGVNGTHEGGITPEGTMLIKQNGVYDVTDKAEVDVQVETVTEPTDPPVFGFGTFNENGEYSAEDYGVDGWSSIKVEVAGSGGDKDPNETYYEMKREDYLRQQQGLIGFLDIPTEEEYLEQQTYVNTTIETIMGVAF